MTWAQQQRMEFIANRLKRAGYINRSHLMDKFGISTPQATTDLKRYMKSNPKAMAYNGTTKRYEANK